MSKDGVLGSQPQTPKRLAGNFLVVSCRTGCPRRALGAVTKLTHIYFEFVNGAAEGVAVHSQLPRCPALVAFVFFQDRRNEATLEFANRFRIKNIAAVHLQHECFELIFHGISLSCDGPSGL